MGLLLRRRCRWRVVGSERYLRATVLGVATMVRIREVLRVLRAELTREKAPSLALVRLRQAPVQMF